MHVHDLALESLVWLTFQNTGNVYTGFFYRYETTTGKWWDRYVNSVEMWRWNRWKDDNPFLDDYIGHPIMGSISDYLWIQNDPKGMTLTQLNTWPYYRSRLRALAWSTFYSFQWKVGPIGEASIGHNGDHFFSDHGVTTNETGDVELVTTPIGGVLWTMAEDALDAHVLTRIEAHTRNPFALLLEQALNPTHFVANTLRFRAPWYRDSRIVTANTYWTEPGGGSEENLEDAEQYTFFPGGRAIHTAADALPEYPLPGGVNEFGASWGLSLITAHVFGQKPDVKFMPMEVNYSHLLRGGDSYSFRYAPVFNALALVDWPTPDRINTVPAPIIYQEKLRERSYASGAQPLGVRLALHPHAMVQPYAAASMGFLFFNEPVLDYNGSKVQFLNDVGIGLQIFRKPRQSISIGYKFQHLGNYGIAANPGADFNTFYVSVSRFRTGGYR